MNDDYEVETVDIVNKVLEFLESGDYNYDSRFLFLGINKETSLRRFKSEVKNQSERCDARDIKVHKEISNDELAKFQSLCLKNIKSMLPPKLRDYTHPKRSGHITRALIEKDTWLFCFASEEVRGNKAAFWQVVKAHRQLYEHRDLYFTRTDDRNIVEMTDSFYAFTTEELRNDVDFFHEILIFDFESRRNLLKIAGPAVHQAIEQYRDNKHIPIWKCMYDIKPALERRKAMLHEMRELHAATSHTNAISRQKFKI